MKQITIIHETDEILIVNKEAGMAVQGGAGITHSIDEDLSKQVGYKVFLVHRLDKDTAGILIVAKNPQAASMWSNLLQTDKVSKVYTALCFGVPVVNGKKMKKKQTCRVEGFVEAHGKKQKAVSSVTVNDIFNLEIPSQDEQPSQSLEMSEVSVCLSTGRMHQIRIQMAQCGAPLCGDDKHGDFKKNKLARKAGLKKLCLAATKLTVPLNGKPFVFEIELPSHFSH